MRFKIQIFMLTETWPEIQCIHRERMFWKLGKLDQVVYSRKK